MAPEPPPTAEAMATPLRMWSVMLDALPMPAALVDAQGFVLDTNRWLDVDDGEALLQPANQEVTPDLRFGVDSTSRWRVRSLDESATVLLATAEREDTGDHLLRRFFSSGDALFVVYDQRGRIIQSNAAWENLLGYSHDDVFGVDSWTLLPEEDQRLRQTVEAELRESGRSEPTFRMRTIDGSFRLVRWALQYDTSVGRCFGVGRDVTEEGRITADLERRAYTDELTSLPNRAMLLKKLDSWLEQSANPALLFCDLDHFKVVNDSLGHQTGDTLLSAFAARLDALATSNDSLVARLGGDEFVIVLRGADTDRAVEVAQEIFTGMHEPFTVLGRTLHVRMSIGIAVSSDHTPTTANALLREADSAAYEAKQLGRNRYVIFDENLRAAVDRRFNVEVGLRHALQTDRIVVHYQPMVAIPGGGIVGIEALVRWRSEGPDGEDELKGPDQFLDVAEEAGLLPAIGHIVLTEAMSTAADFARRGRTVTLSINVSAAELASGDFFDRLLHTIEDTGIDPSTLLLEITESTVLTTEAALPILDRFQAVGIRLGLDDFGTGFSSLAHLRELPIDVVKVDRSFVDDLVDDVVTRAVTGSLVDLCRALGLEVIFEGVESTEQALAVEQLGGQIVQGHLFHKPMPAPELAFRLGLASRSETLGR